MVGMLYLENNLTPKIFTPDRIDLLRLLTSQIVTSLENVMLFETLRRQEEHYRLSFEMAAMGKAHVDCATGLYVRTNSKFSELIGYSKEELLTMTPIKSAIRTIWVQVLPSKTCLTAIETDNL